MNRCTSILKVRLKVSAVLVKKVGKFLPEIRIEGNTVLHYIGDKLHIRRFDAVTKQAIDEPIKESELNVELSKVINPSTVKDISKQVFRKIDLERFKATLKAIERQYQETFLL